MTDESATPPPTGGLAARYGFIRSDDDRKIAGVGVAFARATGTDPLLWRVLLAVLTLFAGAGLVLYLLCWLAFPLEGDETSPAGSLVSSKSSSTSALITLLLALGAGLLGIVAVFTTLGRPFVVFVLVAALVFGLTRRHAKQPPRPQAQPMRDTTQEYTAPFAPHGPYANRTLELPVDSPQRPAQSPPPFTQPTATEPTVPNPPAQSPPPPPAPPPAVRPSRDRSSLGLVVFCLVIIGLGVAAILAMLGVPMSAGPVFAGAVLLCGGGLIVGTWWGRGRGLIALGTVAAIALLLVSVFGRNAPAPPLASQRVEADTAGEIPGELSAVIGVVDVDASAVDFDTADRTAVSVNIWLGAARFKVSEEVDVIVNVEGQRSVVVVEGDEVRLGTDGQCHDCRFDGPDGSGGGLLVVNTTLETGSLEITR